MSRVLISFIGRPSGDTYQNVRYRYPDGTVLTSDTTSLFGLSLCAREKPDRLVIVGTPDSQWSSLLKSAHPEGTDAADALLLGEHSGLLDQRSPTLQAVRSAQQQLGIWLGCDVQLETIGYGISEDDQCAVAQTLASHVSSGDRLQVDVTHGFRHLPLLAMFSIFYIQSVRPNVAVEAVWYGKLRDDRLTADVHRLDGLLQMAKWASAVQHSDASGDWAPFGDLLPGTLGSPLPRASYFERTHQPKRSAAELSAASRSLAATPLDGLGALFTPMLKQRLAGAQNNTGTSYRQHRKMAFESLARNDYLRAALYAREARLTWAIVRHDDISCKPDIYEDREDFSKTYQRSADEDLLWGLRNRMAHGFGTRNKKVEQLMEHEEALRDKLKELLTLLLPDE